jgi:hypothetical protein
MSYRRAIGTKFHPITSRILLNHPAPVSFSRRFFLLSISSGVVVASNTLVMMILLLGHSDGAWFPLEETASV